MLVRDFLDNWLDTYCQSRLAYNTIKFYKNHVYNHVNPYIGNSDIHGLLPDDIQHLYILLAKQGLNGTTVLGVHRTLHCAFNTGVKSLVLERNICDYVYAPLKSRFRGQVLQASELVRLLNCLKDTEIYLPVLLAGSLGLRRGEVLGLRWPDVDFDSRTVTINVSVSFDKFGTHIHDVKTLSSNRTLQLSDFVLGELKCSRGASGDFICVRKSGLPVTSWFLQKQFAKALKDNGFPSIRFHDLRHSFATLMLKNQINSKLVSSFLGHSNVSITLDTYSHVMTEMQQPITDLINNTLFGK